MSLIDSLQKWVLGNTNYLYGVIVLLCIFELMGDILFSQWVNKNPNPNAAWGFFAAGIVSYLIMTVIFAFSLLSRRIALVNTLWQAGSVIFGMLWGYFYFKEQPTHGEWLGFFVILAGIILVSSGSEHWSQIIISSTPLPNGEIAKANWWHTPWVLA